VSNRAIRLPWQALKQALGGVPERAPE
jgi:hypothetical protein